MDPTLSNLVRRRADHCCEYCRLHQDQEPYYRFHIEHIIARQHGGGDEADNLALACHHCNFQKGPNLTSIDPSTGQVVALFHPRRQKWDDHFQFQECTIIGRTPTGRATVRLLQMNALSRFQLRQAVQHKRG